MITQFKPATPTDRLLALRFERGTYRLDEDDQLEKRCCICHEFWPADSEFFHTEKSSDGLRAHCKACHSEKRMQYSIKHTAEATA